MTADVGGRYRRIVSSAIVLKMHRGGGSAGRIVLAGIPTTVVRVVDFQCGYVVPGVQAIQRIARDGGAAGRRAYGVISGSRARRPFRWARAQTRLRLADQDHSKRLRLQSGHCS